MDWLDIRVHQNSRNEALPSLIRLNRLVNFKCRGNAGVHTLSVAARTKVRDRNGSIRPQRKIEAE